MVDIQSKEAIDQMSEDLKIQPSMALPRTLKGDIQPVYAINNQRGINLLVDVNRAVTSAGFTVHTTSTEKDTYLWGVTGSWLSDATADNVSISLFTKIFGHVSGQAVFRMNKLTTTAHTSEQSIFFTVPIKLQPATTITFSNTFTVGASSGGMIIFLEERDRQ